MNWLTMYRKKNGGWRWYASCGTPRQLSGLERFGGKPVVNLWEDTENPEKSRIIVCQDGTELWAGLREDLILAIALGKIEKSLEDIIYSHPCLLVASDRHLIEELKN